MTTKRDAFPPEFLGAEDITDGEVVTVTRTATKKAYGDVVHALYFAEKPRGIRLNKTNWERIEMITGEPHFERWVGTKLTLTREIDRHPDGRMAACLRIKLTPEAMARMLAGDESGEDSAPIVREVPAADEPTPMADTGDAAPAMTPEQMQAEIARMQAMLASGAGQ